MRSNKEKRGGWVLVEKFDDYRLRIKCTAGTKMVEGDFAVGYDLYRRMLGPSRRKVVAAAVLTAVALVFEILAWPS